jgi:hypothetical protein
MSALKLIKQVNLSSTATSITVDNVFSSTYQNYKIVMENFTTSGTGRSDIRFLDSTGTEITSNYAYGLRVKDSNGNNATLYSGSGTELRSCFTDTFNGAGGLSGYMNIGQPFDSSRNTTVSAISNAGDSGAMRFAQYGGQLAQAVSCRGFKYINSQTLDATGSIYVFGFSES